MPRPFPSPMIERLKAELGPYLAKEPAGEKLKRLPGGDRPQPQPTNDFLVDLNQRLSRDIRYLIRMEPNVQSCEQTLTLGSGSCRDSAWLLVNILRHLGLAARFVSGYLIQLAQDVKSLDGPSGPEADFTDLHAWTEVYLPGAGWVGMDPTSGLFAGEGHIPLACSPQPQSAAPITGALEKCEVDFSHTACACDAFAKHPVPHGPTRSGLDGHRGTGGPGGSSAGRGGCAPDHGRRAHLRLHRRHGRRPVEHRGPGGGEAAAFRDPAQTAAQAVGPRRTAALRPGEMVPGRIPAPLGPGLLLAPGRPAGVDRRPLDRRRPRIMASGPTRPSASSTPWPTRWR
jgi:hypothetical protein